MKECLSPKINQSRLKTGLDNACQPFQNLKAMLIVGNWFHLLKTRVWNTMNEKRLPESEFVR